MGMLLPANPSGRQILSCGSDSAKADLVSESAGAQQCTRDAPVPGQQKRQLVSARNKSNWCFRAGFLGRNTGNGFSW